MNFFKSFSLYTTASFIERGISFFLLPIFTFYLSTKDFGILALLTSVFTFSIPLITLGIQGAISVAYFKGDKNNYPSYFTSAIFPPLIVAIFLTAIVFIFNDYITNNLGIPLIWVIFIPLFSFLSFFNSLLLIDYQIKNEPGKYISFSLFSSIINIILSLVLIIVFHYGYDGRLIGQYFSISICFLIAFYILLKKRKLIVKTFSWVNAKDSLLFGLPLVPHIIGGMIIIMSDRLFIDHFLGKEELGIYNIGYVLGSAISILSGAFANAIIPFSYELFSINTVEAKAKVVKVYAIFILVMIGVVFFIWLLTPFIFMWFVDHKFIQGTKYVFWIALAYFFQGMYLLFANIIFYLKKTKVLLYYSSINIALNLTLNYLLIPSIGAIGAAYATCISFFVFFVSIAIYCHKIYPLPWSSLIAKKDKYEINQ